MASKNDNKISLPSDFSFPYPKPYDIQLDLMRSLFKTLELKKIGIFESPTGSVSIQYLIELIQMIFS
jgi:chromosome transmission fidelity protein 1